MIIKYHWHHKKSVFMENFRGARYSPKITISKFKILILGSGHTPDSDWSGGELGLLGDVNGNPQE